MVISLSSPSKKGGPDGNLLSLSSTQSMAPLSLEQTGDREAEEDITAEPMLLILVIRHAAVARVPPRM